MPPLPRDGASDEATASPRAATFRARLRDETRTAHEQLDAAFAALGDGDPAVYSRFLRVNEACLRAIEPSLAAVPLIESETWRFEPRHAKAAADLSALGARPIAGAPFPIQRPSAAQAIGIAYVLEGARLGGRLILKQLRRTAGPSGKLPPTSFLESAGDGNQFKAFLLMLEDRAPAPAEQDTAIAAANATFMYFLDAVRAAAPALATSGAN